MSEKKLGIILGCVCAAVIVLAGVLYMGRRGGRPEITFSGDAPAYSENITDEELLANVKATDKQDGDLTSQVFISNISVRDTRVEVTYMVKDSDNHVSKASQMLETNGTAAEKKSEAETVTAEVTPELTAEAEEKTETATPEPTETPTPEPTEEVNPEAPVITLNTDAVTLKKGERFSYADYIADFSDNKDTKQELGQSIQVDGADTTTTGTKEVKYYIIDKDGNRSKDAILTLTVE